MNSYYSYVGLGNTNVTAATPWECLLDQYIAKNAPGKTRDQAAAELASLSGGTPALLAQVTNALAAGNPDQAAAVVAASTGNTIAQVKADANYQKLITSITPTLKDSGCMQADIETNLESQIQAGTGPSIPPTTVTPFATPTAVTDIRFDRATASVLPTSLLQRAVEAGRLTTVAAEQQRRATAAAAAGPSSKTFLIAAAAAAALLLLR